MPGPTIHVVDDHEPVRAALVELLTVFGFACRAFASAEAFLGALGPDSAGCVVADVRMPGMDGVEMVREMRRRAIDLPVILISGHADVPMAVAAIKAGAEDFIEKPVDDRQLLAAINRALAGSAERRKTLESDETLRERLRRMTPRQIEVFDLVAGGFTNQAIAGRLGISVRTVESYRADVMERMQAESVAALVRQAIRLRRMDP